MAQDRRGRRLMGEINVVPYIDVMLVLLIIFMVTAPLLTQGVKVELPQSGAEPLDVRLPRGEKPLVLSIDREGRLYLNIGSKPGQPLDEATTLARTAAMLRRAPDLPVLVKGDRGVAYGRVVEAMVILQKAGAKKVGFLTDPLPERRRVGA
ncbi:MAG: Biopolymer transport protein ExbD [Steroidobacteraceae bacterium]|nr:Biopolymer transport protein ExbD [Steroidobacteraceae bacterium]